MTSNFKSFEEISIVCEDLQLYKLPTIIQMKEILGKIKYKSQKFLREIKLDCFRFYLISDEQIVDICKDLLNPMDTMNNLVAFLFPGIK